MIVSAPLVDERPRRVPEHHRRGPRRNAGSRGVDMAAEAENPMDLHDRSILLTGAAGGIGRSLALQPAEYESRLTLVGRRAEPLDEVASLVRDRGAQARVSAADLTEPEAAARVVAAAQDRFGDIDVLINNAGNVRAGRLQAIDDAEVIAQIAPNGTARTYAAVVTGLEPLGLAYLHVVEGAPTLTERIRGDWSSFYGGTDAGYIDYPTLDQAA
jgi:nucleoside-diphosphate-sugar epimerase